jgi:hypothetical protein
MIPRVNERLLTRLIPFAVMPSLPCPAGAGPVNLQLTPAGQFSCGIGDTVDIALRVISVDDQTDAVSQLSVCLEWDSNYLSLMGMLDDSDSPYPWLVSYFPDDHGQDRVNNDRSAPGFHPGSFWSEAVS